MAWHCSAEIFWLWLIMNPCTVESLRFQLRSYQSLKLSASITLSKHSFSNYRCHPFHAYSVLMVDALHGLPSDHLTTTTTASSRPCFYVLISRALETIQVSGSPLWHAKQPCDYSRTSTEQLDWPTKIDFSASRMTRYNNIMTHLKLPSFLLFSQCIHNIEYICSIPCQLQWMGSRKSTSRSIECCTWNAALPGELQCLKCCSAWRICWFMHSTVNPPSTMCTVLLSTTVMTVSVTDKICSVTSSGEQPRRHLISSSHVPAK